MADRLDPLLIRVPGPHLGRDGLWTSAALDAHETGLVGDRTALRLPADPKGAFRLNCRDKSLGRLTLPRGVAVDQRLRVFLLDTAVGRVLVHDPSSPPYDPKKPFVPLPAIGAAPSPWDDARNPRRFIRATSLAVDEDNLYVVDRGGCRVLVFALDSWALREVWTFAPRERPRDVVTHGRRVYILTSDAVYAWRPGDDVPRRLVKRLDDARPWERMAADIEGGLYLLPRPYPGIAAHLQVFIPGQGMEAEPVRDPADVRDQFPFPVVYTWPEESANEPLHFVLPEPLARPCGRAWPEPLPGCPLETNFTHLPAPDPGEPQAGAAFVFDRWGNRVDAAKVRPPRSRLFAREGEWISGRLDSRLYHCVWDVGELDFADLPAGCLAEVTTLTNDEALTPERVRELPATAWSDGLTVVGTPREPAGGRRVPPLDFLVGSPPGRYLWFKVRLQGDGFTTPALSRVTLRLPRQSYTEYLPAVFLEDEEGRRFLERFLAVFQHEWDHLEADVGGLARLADPRAVPASHLDFLAGWFGQTFENGWSEADRRRFLQALPSIRFAGRRDNGDQPGDDRPGGSRRGTLAALRDYLAALLPAVAGGADPRGFPFVIEGFRERDYRLLPLPGAAAPRHVLAGRDAGALADVTSPVAPLWGPGLVGRFRLGESSRLDEGKLLPGESPDLDVFASHAHRFRVVVPAALVPGAGAEAVLRRAIEAEKPAHTGYDLQLVGPRFRVGVQSTVGIDTILGGLPAAQLEPAGEERAAAPGAPPRNRLGYDTVLAPAGPVDLTLRLEAGARLGVEAVPL